MSIALYVVLVLAPETPVQLLAECQQAYAKADHGAFSVQFKSKSAGMSRNGKYTVDYARPDAIRFRAQYDQTEVAASDRTLTMIKGVIHGYDSIANEVLSRPAGKAGTLSQRFASVFPLDDPVRIVVDADALATFLKPLTQLTNWKVVKQAGAWVATSRSSGKGTSFSLSFDAATHKLRRVTAVAGSTNLDWVYTETQSRPIEFHAPAGARTVESFFERPIPPKYKSAAAKAVVESSWRAYGHLSSVTYSVSDDDGTVQVSYAKRDIRQKSNGGSWSYMDGRLRAEPKGKPVVDKKGSWRMVDMTVGQLGMPVDPLLRHLARSENPLAKYLSPDLTARLVGQIGFGKVVCDVIELAGKGIKLTLTIRRDTHLLHAVESSNLDGKGHVVARSERRFSY